MLLQIISIPSANFFLNEEIDSFYAAGNTYDGGNIFLNGDSSFIANSDAIINPASVPNTSISSV